MPRKIYSTQKSDIRNSLANAPEEQRAVYEFESFICTWEHTLLSGHPERQGENVGVYFHGTEVLSWDEMGKIEGGKSKNKSLSELPGLQFTFGGTIPQ